MTTAEQLDYEIAPSLERDFVLSVLSCVISCKAVYLERIVTWFDADYIESDFLRRMYESLILLHAEQAPATSAVIAQVISRTARQGEAPVDWRTIVYMVHKSEMTYLHSGYLAIQTYEAWRRRTTSRMAHQAGNELASPKSNVDNVLDNLGELKNKYCPPPQYRDRGNRDILTAMVEREAMGGAKVEDVAVTGIGSLDKLLDGGLRPGTMTVVGGRPSSGKSALLGQFAAVHCFPEHALEDHAALFFTLEMTNEECFGRWHKWLCAPPARMMRMDAYHRMDKAHIELFAGTRTIREIEHITTSFVRHTNRRVSVFVDYLQLVRSDLKDQTKREQVVADISHRLKQLALNLPTRVVVACQMNRSSADAKGPPKLHHLRESGAIEQDADYALLLHDEPAEAAKEKVTMPLVLAKNRHGAKGLIKVLWDRPAYRFYDLSKEEEPF